MDQFADTQSVGRQCEKEAPLPIGADREEVGFLLRTENALPLTLCLRVPQLIDRKACEWIVRLWGQHSSSRGPIEGCAAGAQYEHHAANPVMTLISRSGSVASAFLTPQPAAKVFHRNYVDCVCCENAGRLAKVAKSGPERLGSGPASATPTVERWRHSPETRRQVRAVWFAETQRGDVRPSSSAAVICSMPYRKSASPPSSETIIGKEKPELSAASSMKDLARDLWLFHEVLTLCERRTIPLTVTADDSDC